MANKPRLKQSIPKNTHSVGLIKKSKLYCNQSAIIHLTANRKTLECELNSNQSNANRQIEVVGKKKEINETMAQTIHRETTIWTQLLLLAIVLLTSSIQLVDCGCRMQERNPCETICQFNATRKSYDCTLRVIVILPKKDTVEASLPRVINDSFFPLANSKPTLIWDDYTTHFCANEFRWKNEKIKNKSHPHIHVYSHSLRMEFHCDTTCRHIIISF